jgi:hypothetical protein
MSNQVKLDLLKGEVEQFIARMGALDGSIVQALQTYGDKNMAKTIVEAIGPAALASSVTTADLLGQVFKGTPFENILTTLTERPLAVAREEDSTRLTK